MNLKDDTHNFVARLIERLPPLKRRREPSVAAVWGFLFGGIGLGIYFRSWIDFFFPVVIWLCLSIVALPTGEILLLLAPVFCAIYGYFRAETSNRRRMAAPLDERQSPTSTGKSPQADKIDGIQSQPPPIPPDSSARTRLDVEGRLEQLARLREKGLVSEEEFNVKRQQILTEL